MDEDNFNNELQNFFDKLREMIENQELDNMPGVDPEQLEQLKELMSQFDDMKDEMKIEIFKLDPFTKQILSSLLGKLSEVGFMPGSQPSPMSASAEPATIKEKELKDIPGTNENLSLQLAQIDKRLRDKQLTDNEINELLDRRAEVVAKMKP